MPAPPEIRLTTGPLLGAPSLAVPVHPGPDGPRVGAGATELATELGLDLGAHLTRSGATGEPGEIGLVPLPGGGAGELHLVGVGDASPAALRKAGAALARATRDLEELRSTVVSGCEPAAVAAFAEGLLLASYTYDAGRSKPKPARLRRVELVTEDAAAAQSLERTARVATAVRFARDLVNTPSLVKTPAWLANEAVRLAATSGLHVTVRDESALAAEGFGGVLAVGAGSTRPPRLVELRYAPRGARRHVVLVGKGITFDSGGLSLKPNDGMVAMKTDMAGGAAVIAVMSALRDLGVRARVTGLVPAAENLPSGTAQRPGDVIRHYGGRTVEVLNTDAEGRLVLADALAYADLRLRPDYLVDIATLTGAASLGLGRRHGALYASTDELAEELLAAAADAGERLWRMPLVEDYRDGIDSEVADLANIGRRPYQGGSIIAALFLREFTGGRPWAHLDVAGPARAEGDEDDVTKGGTGFGVRLLLRWLESLEGGS